MEDCVIEYQKLPEWELLTRACLAEKQDEIEKIVTIWSQKANPHDMDYKSMRLVPYFLDHLKKFNIPVPHEKRLKVIYKYWWLKSSWILHELDRITELFHSQGISLMVTKGAALNQFYDKPLHRTMVDIDIIVPKNEVVRAFELLVDHGFRGEIKLCKLYKYFPNMTRSRRHAFYLINKKSGLQIDLHWAMGNNLPEDVMEYTWKNALQDSNNKKRKLPPKHVLFVMNAINGVMSQDHHGNWILDSKILLSSFSKKDLTELRNFVAVNKFPIWHHVHNYLCQFGVEHKSLDIGFKENLAEFPEIAKIREQPTLLKMARAFVNNFRCEWALRRLVNNEPSLISFSYYYLMGKIAMLILFPFVSEQKQALQWKEHRNI